MTREYWTDPCGIKRLIPSSKYPLTNTITGKALHAHIFECSGAECRICKRHLERGVFPCVDHIIPRGRGGTNSPENLQAICTACNNLKGQWFDKNPPYIAEMVRAVMKFLHDDNGDILLGILTVLKRAKVVREDSIKRVHILINSGIISGEYNDQQT